MDERDMDGDLSQSSEMFSRESASSREGDQPEERQPGRRRNRGNNEIRSRLRSISNTISRIRSSISSMRTLIFNNLGRGEGEEGTEGEIRQLQENIPRVSVNAQVPIISSPGDIASVHNIFDRFVDRQMVNIIGGNGGGDNQPPNRPQNRNNDNGGQANNGNGGQASNDNGRQANNERPSNEPAQEEAQSPRPSNRQREERNASQANPAPSEPSKDIHLNSFRATK